MVGVIGVIAGIAAEDLSAQVDAAAGADRKPEPALRIQGSDTMLQMNLAFAKEYSKQHPMEGVGVDGMGSSVGFKALIEGEAEIACSSRPIKDAEKARIKMNRGADAIEHVVAYDVIAVFVHAKNDLGSVSLETLKGIFFEGGKTARWDQIPGAKGSMGAIELVGRSSASGTYAAFSQAVAGAGIQVQGRDHRDGRLGRAGRKGRFVPPGDRLCLTKICDYGRQDAQARSG